MDAISNHDCYSLNVLFDFAIFWKTHLQLGSYPDQQEYCLIGIFYLIQPTHLQATWVLNEYPPLGDAERCLEINACIEKVNLQCPHSTLKLFPQLHYGCPSYGWTTRHDTDDDFYVPIVCKVSPIFSFVVCSYKGERVYWILYEENNLVVLFSIL